MIPKEAIEKAIEGGWEPVANGGNHPNAIVGDIKNGLQYFLERNGNSFRKHLTEIALDSSFWQSLGKALGWKLGWHHTGLDNSTISNDLYYALIFHTLILTGGDTKAFWDELLKSKSV